MANHVKLLYVPLGGVPGAILRGRSMGFQKGDEDSQGEEAHVGHFGVRRQGGVPWGDPAAIRVQVSQKRKNEAQGVQSSWGCRKRPSLALDRQTIDVYPIFNFMNQRSGVGARSIAATRA